MADRLEPVAQPDADAARRNLSEMLMAFAVIRELTKTQQESAERTIEEVRAMCASRDTYFAERNSARDAWRRRVKQCEALEAKLAAQVAKARAEERERCATLCVENSQRWPDQRAVYAANECAAAIRQASEQANARLSGLGREEQR